MSDDKPSAEAMLEMLDEVNRRLPDGRWEVATSDSFRRINGPDGRDGGVLHALVHRDGQPDLSMDEEQLRFLCHIRNALPALAQCLRGLVEVRQIIASIRDDFDIAIAAHDTSDPRHPSHGGQHHNGPCCPFGNVTPGALRTMREWRDAIDRLAADEADAKGGGK